MKDTQWNIYRIYNLYVRNIKECTSIYKLGLRNNESHSCVSVRGTQKENRQERKREKVFFFRIFDGIAIEMVRACRSVKHHFHDGI